MKKTYFPVPTLISRLKNISGLRSRLQVQLLSPTFYGEGCNSSGSKCVYYVHRLCSINRLGENRSARSVDPGTKPNRAKNEFVFNGLLLSEDPFRPFNRVCRRHLPMEALTDASARPINGRGVHLGIGKRRQMAKFFANLGRFLKNKDGS